MLGLRTAAGLPYDVLRRISPAAVTDSLLSEGALCLVPSQLPSPRHIRIPEDRFFVSDDIIARLLL